VKKPKTVHYWDGTHMDPAYPAACGRSMARLPFKFWQQRKWKGVTCVGCLRTRSRRPK
jgi:hypothetical protein